MVLSLPLISCHNILDWVRFSKFYRSTLGVYSKPFWNPSRSSCLLLSLVFLMATDSSSSLSSSSSSSSVTPTHFSNPSTASFLKLDEESSMALTDEAVSHWPKSIQICWWVSLCSSCHHSHRAADRSQVFQQPRSKHPVMWWLLESNMIFYFKLIKLRK